MMIDDESSLQTWELERDPWLGIADENCCGEFGRFLEELGGSPILDPSPAEFEHI